MFITSHFIVFPEGETREVAQPLGFNELVDINGKALTPPLSTHKTIVYRVFKISRDEGKGGTENFYHLELVRGEELFSLVAGV